MIRFFLLSMMAVMLSGCGIFGKDGGLTVFSREQPKTPLALPDPTPLRTGKSHWIVITPENASQVWAELKNKNIDLVLFALTDDGYEELSADAARTRNFISQQREIIIRYRQYYEPTKEDTKKP